MALLTGLPPRSLTASLPLKNGGWKTILSYWEGNFSGATLVLGGGSQKYSMWVDHSLNIITVRGLKFHKDDPRST